MCLGAHSEKTPVRPVKQLIVFHWMPQNNWHPLVLTLTSMWKSCGKKRLMGGLAPHSGPLINRLAQQQQWQFLLACGVAGHVCTEITLHLPLSLRSLNNVASARFRSPAHFLVPGGCPELASLLEVLTLLQLALSEVAAHHRVAVLIDAVGGAGRS